MIKKPFMGWIGLVALLFAAGCTRALSASTALPSTVSPAATNAPLVVLIPTSVSTTAAAPSAATIAPTTAPTVAPTNGPYEPFQATAMVNALKVRTNPGYLFPALGILPENTALTVLGRAPGGEWIYIQTPDEVEGWVFAQLLVTDRDWKTVPIIEPEGVQIIRGKVTDVLGNPVSGIQYAITQGDERNDAMTDETGKFTAFMPLTASGEWTVSYTAVSCESNTMDANCNCKGGSCATSDPAAQTIMLPQKDPLEFVWK